MSDGSETQGTKESRGSVVLLCMCEKKKKKD